MDISVWFLPVFSAFFFSLLNLLFFRMAREKRRWLSLFGGVVVLSVCIYHLHSSYAYLSSWQNMGFMFAILISAVSLLCISYSQWYNPESNFAYDALLFLFIGSMNGVVLSASLIAFYLFWEVMAFSSFFLVLYNNTDESRRASVKYIIMTGAGSIFLLFGILGLEVLNQSIIWDHLFFFSLLVGAGIKAGIFPLHSWLPDAHPAAPTPVSAMLSGIMIKTGVFALIRFYFTAFHPAWSPGWEGIMMILGMLTLMVGVLLALVQHDIKRLLAFHSISQIGYIMLGIACGTSIGLMVGLYHVINHAIFKSLLFLAAGVLIKVTGSRELKEYGGLSRQLPFTFGVFTVASLSISGVPPFNGFVSKWIIYQALLTQGRPLAVVAMIVALLGSVLTLASFIKVLNDAFLGVRRAEVSPKAGFERSSFMNLPMALLAISCLVFGVFPGFVTRSILGPAVFEPVALNIELISAASFYGWLAFIVIILMLLFGRRWLKSARVSGTFVGGEKLTRQDTAFDGSHFYRTLREIGPVDDFYSSESAGLLDIYEASRKRISSITEFFNSVGAGYFEQLYSGGRIFLNGLVGRLKLFQSGIIAKYIIWIFVGVIMIMEVLRR